MQAKQTSVYIPNINSTVAIMWLVTLREPKVFLSLLQVSHAVTNGWKECFAWPLSFKYALTKIHQTFFTLQLYHGIPWAYQLPLCNYRTMTSYLCQQFIAHSRLTVKGFLLERKAHCVSAKVMRLFPYTHGQQHRSKLQTTINHCADFTALSVGRLKPSTHD